MNDQPPHPSGQSSLEEQATVIMEGFLKTIYQSLDALRLSVRSQEQTVGALRRLNKRGLRSAQETRMLEATVGQLIVSQLLRGAVRCGTDGGEGTFRVPEH